MKGICQKLKARERDLLRFACRITLNGRLSDTRLLSQFAVRHLPFLYRVKQPHRNFVHNYTSFRVPTLYYIRPKIATVLRKKFRTKSQKWVDNDSEVW